MVHAPYTVLDQSNLTSRVTRLIANLRKLEVSSQSKLKELYEAGQLHWLHDCLSTWFTKPG